LIPAGESSKSFAIPLQFVFGGYLRLFLPDTDFITEKMMKVMKIKIPIRVKA